MINKTSFIFVLLLILPFLITAAYADNVPQVMFILDGSGSMWGKAGDQTKIESAREVMSKVVPSLPSEVKVGLMSYGHRVKSDCNDIEVIIPIGSASRDKLISRVNKINPKGRTPIAASLKIAADEIKTSENETTIILVSDGEETCHDDTCGVVKELKSLGINFVLHVVGFGVTDLQKEQLSCLADAGGGKYYGADNSEALLSAFETIKTEVVEKVEKAKTATVKTTSRLGKLHITLPESSRVSLANIRIIRSSNNKTIKTIKEPQADSTHPLLAGEYEVVFGFANVNYRDPSDASIGKYEVKGGETTDAALGSVGFNIAPSLREKGPAYAVSIIKQGTDEAVVTVFAFDGNSHYLFKPKAVPAGIYDLGITYAESPGPSVVAAGINVEKGKETVITLDSGISIKKPGSDQGIVGWDLVPTGTKEPSLIVKRRWDNKYPLWQKFMIQPGSYDIYVHVNGMDEPLLVGEGVEISKGQLLEFDTVL